MTDRGLGSVKPRQRRLLVARALCRSALNVTVLVVLYYLVPTRRPEAAVVIGLVCGSLVFLGVSAWQFRAIQRSRYPALRAIEGLATLVPLFLLLFAFVYVTMASADGGSFSEPLNHTDALYFTVTVFSTVGFGDITPLTGVARVVTMAQMIGDLLVIGVLLKAVLGLVRAQTGQPQTGQPQTGQPQTGQQSPPAPPGSPE
jgi:hypothetical protein